VVDVDVVLGVGLVGLDLPVEVGLEGDHLVDDVVLRRLCLHRPHTVGRIVKRPGLPPKQVLRGVQLVGPLHGGLRQWQ
jgi:hypothetical protein